MSQELHRHSFYFILFLQKGSGTHIIDFVQFPLSSYSIHILRPGQVHELKLDLGSMGYIMQFSDEFCLGYDEETKLMVKKISQLNYYQTDIAVGKQLSMLLKRILKEDQERKEKYEYVIRTNLQLFFVDVLRQNYSLIHGQDKISSYRLERLEEFKELVVNHGSTHKKIYWYAQKMRLSAYQLNLITRTTLGKPASEIINNYIILEAKRYLLATNNQIKEIAWHLGYEDVPYFIRVFKKNTAHSPQTFRNKFK